MTARSWRLPEDFWPLNDTSGPLAHDMVGGATAASPRPAATYANVTLGVAGPTGFADGTAASFGGTGSQVTVPGGYFGGTGAESAELWFKTAHGTLLSSSTGQNGGSRYRYGSPLATVPEGMIGSTPLNAPYSACSAGNAADGKWHQAILTLSAGTTTSNRSARPRPCTRTAPRWTPRRSPSRPQPPLPGTRRHRQRPERQHSDFTGSIADVSLYTTELTPTGHQPLQRAGQPDYPAESGTSNPLSPPASVTLPTLNTQTITVTDPVQANSVYVYASGALVQTIDVLGGVTSYGYDAAQRASTITDPDGDTTYLTHDAHNNVTSTTTCAAVNNCQTSYASYYENLSNPLDPRNDKPTDSRDARSSSPSDPAYDTVTTYTAAGQIATKATPPTPACPSGCKTTYAYTAGTEAAVGGGTEPAGLVASITAPAAE